MGSIYRPKYRAADGTLKESSVLWLKSAFSESQVTVGKDLGKVASIRSLQ